MKQWYEELFDNYGNQYDKEIFVQGTMGECDFIEKELDHDRSKKILDIGCGTGRHAIELTKRGYQVTGIDLSEGQLKRAREKAEKEGFSIPFLQMDARNLPFKKEFDVAIMLCEGGFPLMETDEMNFELKEKGKFIFTTLNGLFPLFHSINEFHDREEDEGARYLSETFDLMTMRDRNVTTFIDDDGKELELLCNERYYLPSEITWLLKSLGFKTIDISEDYEMLVIAER